ncbi:alpha/beta hydrolase family protein [Acidianus manzaensis]|uniref:Acylaminoacyl-peptidase n=1 Tax=Acidianus manzaensis TaxID=282676 RepID=A0A1W6K2E3_9CREN|nr:S9 family peptidase [Acidianus manzaensis]ARM76698.1 acylaminoacyl-peptidase [Acidianus manzaensis]
MEPEDAYSIKILSDVRLTEKGLLHVETYIENNKYKSSIFLNKKELLSGSVSHPIFKDDYLYFVEGEKTNSLIKQGEYGSKVSLFSLGKIIDYTFHVKGILIIGEEKADKKLPFEANTIKYRFDSRGLLRSRRSLYLFDGKELRKIVSGNFDVTAVATNGKRVIISSTMSGDDYNLSDIFEVNLDNGELKRITEGEGEVDAIAMNEQGQIAYLGHRKGKQPWATKEIIFPEEGKSVICGNTCGNNVLSDLFDGSKDKIVFEKDEVISEGQTKGSTNLYKISDNKAEQITEGKIVVKGFDYTNGKLAYYYTTPEKPSLLYYNNEIYDPNPNVKGKTPEEINNGEIEGWAIITGKNNPIILFIHGGPHTAYGYSYFIEFQFFANNGYNVIYCNPRGSQGYGEDFAKACVGDWGGKDMEDILSFTKKVIEKYNLSGKIGVTGGSYGGFMTNWIITKTNMFSAAISERSISNLVSMCGTSDIGFWFNAIESGIDDPWTQENILKLMKISPIYYVKNVKTPTMFIHGEEDYRCPIEQAEQYYTALKMNGIPTVLVRYQGDSHEHARRGKPNNMRDRLQRKLEWFNKYLK